MGVRGRVVGNFIGVSARRFCGAARDNGPVCLVATEQPPTVSRGTERPPALRFLHQPSRPKPPRPVAKSGRALTVPNCQFLDSGPKLAWQFVRCLKFGS